MENPPAYNEYYKKRSVSSYSLDYVPPSTNLMNGSSTTKLTEQDSIGEHPFTISASTMGIPVTSGTNTKGNSYETEYDPFEHRDKSKATTDSGALLHLIKSSLGSGILAMPSAFKNSGLIFGLFGTIAIGALCTHCIYLLVICSQILAKRIKKPSLGFAETAAVAFETGPKKFRAWAPFAREFVNAALFATYYFGNTVYVVFVATSFKQVFDNHVNAEYHWPIQVWILMLALPLVPLGLIRTMKVLVPFSAIATTFIMVGLSSTMYFVVAGESFITSKDYKSSNNYIAPEPLPSIDSRPWIAPLAHMPLFFSTVLFAMEGIGTVLPIENSMKNPQRFLQKFGVLNSSMVLVVALYTMAGFLGYLRFGPATLGSITLNLPEDIFAELVKIMVALSILFSYGLQFCVPSEIMWKRIEPVLRRRRELQRKRKGIPSAICDLPVISQPSMELDYYTMRGLMILGTVLIAALVPELSPFISLIGSIFFSILGLFCPAVIHIITFWADDSNPKRETNSRFVFWKNILVIVISLVALVAGTYASMIDIIHFYKVQSQQGSINIALNTTTMSSGGSDV
ncbi:proton-coupled amino acid transporter-like protein pathetic isoform X1 [Daktulosphaira vitifoliae]|uniref:proton-coupled amino acid transporter-like protein pathetic isoform X1 n=2 Tax=Daktulosphaira vitifoliae TaxID=58002 RepID=UPI0021AAB56C|nr:proton-coupled amino acid transporter-like protein pathetic isoform X1 [Daktulosphaira vitifoliae]XP_050530848.1 proton-coupled amino acid transporter-like protein pathetic isoform X1 [Daktulosphaira vitifoliae]XP_050530849.1 proton-coupled amino acid transporter-like protein pathetic isoform X1 [Daktulosphaira vitifoliae]